MSVIASFMVPHPPMIIPEVGRGREESIRDTTGAYEEVARRIAEIEPETIVIISPHYAYERDCIPIASAGRSLGDMGQFGAPGVKFDEECDKVLADYVSFYATEKFFPAFYIEDDGAVLDHGSMVPLYFIRKRYKGGKILRIGLSELSAAEHYQFGMILRKAIDFSKRRTVIVASGDLSHRLKKDGPYGLNPYGPKYDDKIMDVMGRAAFGELLEFDPVMLSQAAECGHRSFAIMAGALDGLSVEAERLSHQDVTGVGYGICIFMPGVKDDGRHFYDELVKKVSTSFDRTDPYVSLAWDYLKDLLEKGRSDIGDDPSKLPSELTGKRAGVFVSLHKLGELRGCMGTIGPTQPSVAKEIMNNAYSAAYRDPRFSAVKLYEFPLIDISVDVLGEPEDIDSEDMLDVKRYGVIVTSGFRRGLLLPDLEGVDDVKTQVRIALSKGGISPDEDYKLQRFEVIRHGKV